MLLERKLSRYSILSEDSILNALKKISENRKRFVFCLDDSGVLEGVLTDGDFRRWLVGSGDADLNEPVSRIANRKFVSVSVGEEEKIPALFSDRIEVVPVLDAKQRLVAIGLKRFDGIEIGSFTIGEKSPAFVIAEIGNNHNGRLDLAKELIDQALWAGADCVKFQMRDMATLYCNNGNADDCREDLGSQYVLDLLARFQLPPEKMFEAFDYCLKKGILPLCTPWDNRSVESLEKWGMEAYKVASADLTNHYLLERLSATGRPLICSTGMSTEEEIKSSVSLLRRLGTPFVLLQCNATYPAPFKDIQLVYMERLREMGDCPVGYSGHERGYHVPIAAVARGAKVIEKHLTLDKTMEGNDHKVSLLSGEFREMVSFIRDVEAAMGTKAARVISQGERINRETLAKSLFVNADVVPGQVITDDMVEVKSPGRGLQPNRRKELIGSTIRRAMTAGDYFYPSDLEPEQVTVRRYRFDRPWGIPVRYHDFSDLVDRARPDFVEFHMSYKDLDIDPDRFIHRTYDIDFAVHSPELFAGDHIMDLCAESEEIRERSIRDLERVIERTRQMGLFFPGTRRPLIIVNVGGATGAGHISPEKRSVFYERLSESLSQIDSGGVELIPQTMPPFPWHIGGQQFHNLFIAPEDIERFCTDHGMRICLDVSHSKLACNHFRWSFSEFLQTVGRHVAHIHMGDAEGVDGEGLQILEGEIDFAVMAEILRIHAPAASFIPEIWQGHKNDGEGFWVALDRLERWMEKED